MNGRRKVCGWVLIFVLIAAASLAAQEWVRFDGPSSAGTPLKLAGVLTTPPGEGPFPAVVMLCGCLGFQDEMVGAQQSSWVKRLVEWGYVTLQVDSFGPRGREEVCGNPTAVSNTLRAQDAFAAKAYLEALSIVSRGRIAVMGWSHGGWAVMSAVDAAYRESNTKPFRAAVAVYPYCTSTAMRDTPLLILAGAKDDWCPPLLCQNRTDGTKDGAKYELKLEIYPNAYHMFDFEGLDTELDGHHVEYDPEATAAAGRAMKRFLSKYLRARR